MANGDKPFALNPIQWLATDDGWLDFTRELDREELLSQIKQAGFDAVMVDVPAGWSLERYKELLAATDLRPAPGYFSVNLPEDDAERRKLLERAAAVAREHAALGLGDIFLGTGMSVASMRVQHPAQGYAADPARLERLTALIENVATAMLSEGVRPALHPHVGTWVETEDEARVILDAIDEQLLGFGPDTGHLAWAQADVSALIADYANRVASIHVKDCRLSVAARARRENLSYRETVVAGLWVEPGRGEIELDSILGTLPADFDGWLIVEVDRPDIPDPLQSAKVSAEWMSRRAWAVS